MAPLVTLLLGVFLSLLLWGARSPASDEEAINDDVKKRIGNGISLAPILGYDPTYGVLLGGAFFRGDTTPPMSNFQVFLYGTFKSVFGVESKLTYWNRDRLFYKFEVEASNFYDSYYGEGNATTPAAQIKIDAFKAVVNPSVWWRSDRHLSFGLLSELRYRNEIGVGGNKVLRIFGNDFTPVFGVGVEYDLRDHQVDTKEGQYYLAKLDYGLSALSTRRPAQDFVRVQLESRHFAKVSESLVLAGQLSVGAAAGDPGYQYRFNLGGSRKLRGYQVNRLRGRFFYMTQGEARLSLLRWFGLVGFAGIGDVGDRNPGDFGKPKLTGGAGLRLGLPPDFVAKARLDFAFSPDETAFYLNFNEAF